MNNIYDFIKEEINKHSENNENAGKYLLSHLDTLRNQKLNILFVGATGSGKSSTINAIFNREMAKVGDWTDPETDVIDHYEIDNLILWDSPGLGDSPEKDRKYAKSIANLLTAKDHAGNLLIDAVVVVVDATSRDLGTVYEMLKNVIAPYLGDNNRIVIAINQCDAAMSGRHWDDESGQPDITLLKFLEEKSESVSKRISEVTNINTPPVYYSALHRYNISKLLLTIMNSIPVEKRFMIAEGLNRDPNVWKKNDSLRDYNTEIQSEMKLSISSALQGAATGAAAGAAVGSFIPIIGSVVGATIGGALGFLGGLFGK